MMIRLPRLCQECSCEFWIDCSSEKDGQKLEVDKDGRAWVTCPICLTHNFVYKPSVLCEDE